jgi:hypothetical protein
LQQVVNVTPNAAVNIVVGGGGIGGGPYITGKKRNKKPRTIAGEDGDSGEGTIFNGQYTAAGGQGGQGGTARDQASGGATGGGSGSGGSGSDKYYESIRGGNGVTIGVGVVGGGGTGGFDWDVAPGVNGTNFPTRYPAVNINALLNPVPGGGGSATVNGQVFYQVIPGVPLGRRTPPGPGNPGADGLGGGGGGGGGGKNNTSIPPQNGGDAGCGAAYVYWGVDEKGIVIT